MEFRKNWEFRKTKGEYNDGKSRVETAGYIPAKIRIEQIIDAGRRLVEYRKEQFDYVNGEDDMEPDIRVRSKAYDLADASQDLLDIKSRKKVKTAPEPSSEEEKPFKEPSVKEIVKKVVEEPEC